MGWRERLQPASLRGIPFLVERIETTFERRTVRHEIPGQEAPIIEDLGRGETSFAVDAYFLGDDHDLKARLLINALERPPGNASGRYAAPDAAVFVHPIYGRFQVAVLSARITYSNTEGRISRVSMQLEKSGSREIVKREDAQAASKLLETQAALEAAAAADASRVLSVTRVPEFVRKAVQDACSRIGRLLQKVNVFTGAARELSAASRSITSLIQNASALATSPADLVREIFAGVTSISDASTNALDAFHAYRSLPDSLDPELDDFGSSSALASVRNESETLRIARYAAAVGAARSAVAVKWASHEDAIAARAGLLEEIDALQLEAPDEVFRYLEDVRARVVSGVPPQGKDLPHVGTFIAEETLPALKLAYRLYGNLARYDDVVGRNRLQHPAYAPGGVSLEVLVG